MKPVLLAWLFVVSAAALTSCSYDKHSSLTVPEDCADDGTALRVTILDSITGTFAGASATLISSSSDGATFTFTFSASAYPGAYPIPGRPGTYHVLVRKAGYLDWTQSGIAVDGVASGPCKGSPIGTNVIARLVRS